MGWPEHLAEPPKNSPHGTSNRERNERKSIGNTETHTLTSGYSWYFMVKTSQDFAFNEPTDHWQKNSVSPGFRDAHGMQKLEPGDGRWFLKTEAPTKCPKLEWLDDSYAAVGFEPVNRVVICWNRQQQPQQINFNQWALETYPAQVHQLGMLFWARSCDISRKGHSLIGQEQVETWCCRLRNFSHGSEFARCRQPGHD
jgi:hypothetical protein